MTVKIPIGNWKAKDSKGKTFDFFKYQKNNWVLLIFFRGKYCGVCRKLLMQINDNIEKLKKLNVKPLAISGDSKLSAAILKSFLVLDFPNLPDEKLKIAKLFGVPLEEKDKNEYILPTLFLINPKHEIVWAKKGENFEDILEFDELMPNIQKKIG